MDTERTKRNVNNSLLTFRGAISHQEVSVLVDGGANGNFISEEAAKRLKLPTTDRKPFEVVYADGHSTIHKSCVKKVPLKLQGFNSLIDLDIVGLRKFDIILGKTWLSQWNPEINWKDNTIKIRTGSQTALLKAVAIDEEKEERYRKLVQVISCKKLKRTLCKDPGSVGNTAIIFVQEVRNQAKDPNCQTDKGQEFPNDLEQGWVQKIKELPEKFKDVCVNDLPKGLPPTRKISHRICLTPGAEVPSRPPFRLSAKENDEVHKIIKEYLEAGIIRPSCSPGGAPVLLVRKKDGTLRMCVDYRALNKVTIKNNYPLPLIEDLLDCLGPARYFTKIDLKSGYHQVQVAEEDVYKTAFRTRFGQYEFLVVPFGLTGAPGTFMALMNDTFREELLKYVVVFLDDILVFSKTAEEHYQHVKLVLDKLHKDKWYINYKKCSWAEKEVEYLGFQVGNGKIAPLQDKVHKIKEWPTPRKERDIQCFMGLANYYRKFIKHFARRAAPLTNLLKKEQQFAWTDECERSFNDIKEALINSPVLQLPNAEKRFFVTTDASDQAVGAILEQEGDKGLHPVAYDSRKLSKEEQRYPTHEKELLGIIQALKTWRHQLLGKKFTVATDHQPLKWLLTQPHLSGRQARWLDTLAEFDFEIVYKAGKENQAADALSRCHLNVVCEIEEDGSLIEEINRAIQEDEHFKEIYQRIKSGNAWPSDADYQLNEKGQLGFKGRLCIPNNCTIKKKLFAEHHCSDISGHLGVIKTYDQMYQRYYWPNMFKDIEKLVTHCEVCQQNKVINQKPSGLLQPLQVPSRRWEEICMDFVSGLPKTKHGFDTIWTIMDRLSKRLHLIPVKATTTAEKLAKLFFDGIFKHHGMPKVIVSDRDPRFCSRFWQELTKYMDTRLAMTTAFHPQANGQIERTNRCVIEMLRTVTKKDNEWLDKLPAIEFAYNNAKNATTELTPFMMDTGRNPLVPANLVRKERLMGDTEARRTINTWSSLLQQARDNMATAQQRAAKYANQGRRAVSFQVGDMVYLSTENLNIKGHTKFKPRYIGPYQVERSIGAASYKLKLPNELKIHPVIHVSRLQKYNSPDEIA